MAKAKTKFKSMREKVRENVKEKENSGSSYLNIPKNTTFFSPKKGKYKIDIIPYVVSDPKHPNGIEAGELWFRRTIFVHYGIGAEEKGYLCLKTVGKRCPICEQRAKLMKDANSDDELVKALKPKQRDLFNVIDLDNEDKGVQLWEFSHFLFGQKLADEIEQGDDDLLGFSELVDGKTLEVRFVEKALGKNKFIECDRIDFKDRDDYDEDILEDTIPLDDILNILPYEKLEAIFLELEEDEKPAKRSKDDDEEDEKPRRNKKASRKDDDEDEEPPRKAKSTRKAKDEDEDEEEEKPRKSNRKPKDDDDDEEEEPKKSKEKSKAKAKPEPEDDEDEDSEDDDEFVCPVKKGKFGVDCDKYDECLSCDIWEDCKKENKALKKKK